MACGEFSKFARQGWKHLKSPEITPNPGGGSGGGWFAGTAARRGQQRFAFRALQAGKWGQRRKKMPKNAPANAAPTPAAAPLLRRGDTDKRTRTDGPTCPGTHPLTARAPQNRYSHQIAPFAAPVSPPPAVCHQQGLAGCASKAGLSKARQPGRIVQQQQLPCQRLNRINRRILLPHPSRTSSAVRNRSAPSSFGTTTASFGEKTQNCSTVLEITRAGCGCLQETRISTAILKAFFSFLCLQNATPAPRGAQQHGWVCKAKAKTPPDRKQA